MTFHLITHSVLDFGSNSTTQKIVLEGRDILNAPKAEGLCEIRLSQVANVFTMSQAMPHAKNVINTFRAIMMASTAPTAQMAISSHASSVPALACAGCGS